MSLAMNVLQKKSENHEEYVKKEFKSEGEDASKNGTEDSTSTSLGDMTRSSGWGATSCDNRTGRGP